MAFLSDLMGGTALSTGYAVEFLKSSATWVAKRSGRAKVTIYGSGGSGALANKAASGGGGGGICEKIIEVEAGDSFTAIVGAGGAAAYSASAAPLTVAGIQGGLSSFVGTGVNMQVTGGAGGLASNTAPASVLGAAGGVATGGDFNLNGGPSGPAISAGTNAAGANTAVAATGGGACPVLGEVWPSGAATCALVSGNNLLDNNHVITGGAGIGGKSGDSTNAGYNFVFSSGGGSGSDGASDIAGTVDPGYSFATRIGLGALRVLAWMLDQFGIGGTGFTGSAVPTTVHGGVGGGGGAVFAVNTSSFAGGGGAFGGGGAGASTATSTCNGGAGGFPGGGGGAARYRSGVSSGKGGNALIVIEWI